VLLLHMDWFCIVPFCRLRNIPGHNCHTESSRLLRIHLGCKMHHLACFDVGARLSTLKSCLLLRLCLCRQSSLTVQFWFRDADAPIFVNVVIVALAAEVFVARWVPFM